MTYVLIIGATGSVGQVTRQYFLDHTDDHLTLMARNTGRLGQLSQRERAVAGSVTDAAALATALQGQNVVFAALSGQLAGMAQSLVTAMTWPASSASYSLPQWESTMKFQPAWVRAATWPVIRCCRATETLPISWKPLI